jgi:hypothetical protein
MLDRIVRRSRDRALGWLCKDGPLNERPQKEFRNEPARGFSLRSTGAEHALELPPASPCSIRGEDAGRERACECARTLARTLGRRRSRADESRHARESTSREAHMELPASGTVAE